MQRDHEPGVTVEERLLYGLQIQEDTGRWLDFLTPREDRDEMTRIQAHRLQDPKHDGERQRVLILATYVIVDEVVGDGEGETTAQQVIDRNTANTERLLQAENQQQPGT